MGQQASILVGVQNPDMVAKLSKINARIMGVDFDPFYGAPTVVVVFADGNRMTYIEDGSLVMGNMMTAAASLGIDSCWVHRAKERNFSRNGAFRKTMWVSVNAFSDIAAGTCLKRQKEGRTVSCTCKGRE